MNKELRIKKIKEIEDKDNPFNKVEIPWKDKLDTMGVYQIPLNLLVYNKYNGRILSRTKSMETQSQKIDEYSEDGEKKLAELSKWNKIHETTFWLWDNATKTSVWTSFASINLMIMQGNATQHLLDGHRKTWAIDCNVLRDCADTDRLEARYGG